MSKIIVSLYRQLFEINVMLFYFINNNLQNNVFDFIMPIITDLGSLIIVLTICFILLAYGSITKNIKIKKLAILGLIAITITTISIYILKTIVAEPRPFVTLTDVNLLIHEADPLSFPSGHSGNIFALATAIGLNWTINLRKKPVKLIWILIPLACLVGFSRIYNGVHYPFDVLIGAFIGMIGGVIATKIGKKYLNNYTGNRALLKRIYNKIYKKFFKNKK